MTGKVPPAVRAGMSDFLERTVAEQAAGRTQILQLLQEAGATE